jgi:hypothetical protein
MQTQVFTGRVIHSPQRTIEVVKLKLELFYFSVDYSTDSVLNNRDSRSGKQIKPHDVEDQTINAC